MSGEGGRVHLAPNIAVAYTPAGFECLTCHKIFLFPNYQGKTERVSTDSVNTEMLILEPVCPHCGAKQFKVEEKKS